MSEPIRTTVLVVGGGPGGYAAAIRAGQLGLETVLVEQDRLGGTCLLRGCIPSKALIHAAAHGLAAEGAASPLAGIVAAKDRTVDRLNTGVAGLLTRAKVRVVTGQAIFEDARSCRVATPEAPLAITAEHVILATGSRAAALPHIPFGGPVISSTEALALTEPPHRLVVVGAGYIGVELGTAFRRLGAAVTLVEARERILPQWDAALTRPVARRLEELGVVLHLGAEAAGFTDGVLRVRKDGEILALPADRVLVTVGRRPNTEGWGLEAMAVDLDGPFVKVDERCHTAVRNVWAIGDLVGEPMLAHKASAQGRMVAEIIAGHRRRFAPAAIPAVCFGEPEIVSVGLSPEAAAAAGHPVLTGSFPFSASGRAMTMAADRTGGFVRVVADAADHRILGVQAVGTGVAELSAAFTLALEMGAVLEDVAATIHAHPTLGEAFQEAAAAALGEPLHA